MGWETNEGLLRRQFPSLLVGEKNIYVYIYLSNSIPRIEISPRFFFTFSSSIGKDRSSSGRLTLLKQLGRLSDSEILREMGKYPRLEIKKLLDRPTNFDLL